MSKIIVGCGRAGAQEAELLARFAYWIAGELVQFAVTQVDEQQPVVVTHIDSGRYMCRVARVDVETHGYQRAGFLTLRETLSQHDEQHVLKTMKETPKCPSL